MLRGRAWTAQEKDRLARVKGPCHVGCTQSSRSPLQALITKYLLRRSKTEKFVYCHDMQESDLVFVIVTHSLHQLACLVIV